MAAVEVKVDGLAELVKQLETLPARIQRKVIRQAQNKAATPMLKTARRFAPKGKPRKSVLDAEGEIKNPGRLRKSLMKKTKSYPSGNIVTVIGPRHKAAPHAMLVHGGTRRHLITSKYGLSIPGLGVRKVIVHPGAFANPFLSDALDAQKANAMNIQRTEIAKGIEKEASKKA